VRSEAGAGSRWRLAVCLALLLALAACRHDMYDQPRYKPLAGSAFFVDDRSARTPPPGTIPRGHLDADPAFYEGQVNGRLVTQFPLPVTPALVERGRQRFNIYCAPCHARLGDGNGMIVQRGYTRPPTFHQDRLRTAPVGHFFDVITNGWGAMPDYAAQVPPRDRWAIIAYIRALQLSQNAPLADVPPAHRAGLGHAPPPSQPVQGKRGLYESRVPLPGGSKP
jgi:mono/diheme cytochrome c family protein